MPRSPRFPRAAAILTALAALGATAGGCALFELGAALAQSHEDQKLVEILPKYNDLNGRTVAVIVDAPLDVLYEHPTLVQTITGGVTLRIARDVENVRVVPPAQIVQWQWKNPDWASMPYGEIVDTIGVDRVIYVDIYEYRLNPPGNRWLWEGVCAATIGVIEKDSFDPDSFADTFDVSGAFPTVSGVDRSAATADQIQTGVLAEFIKRSAWLFHKHLEPKNPDRYRPELEGA